MTRWEISLSLSHRFSPVELEEWLDLFNSPACKVTRKKDGFYLTACRLENLDYDEMYKSAKKLKIMMRGFAKIELGIDFQSREHEAEEDFGVREYKDGESAIYARAKSVGSVTSAGKVTAHIVDKNGNVRHQKRQEHWYDYYLDRCDDWIDSTVMFKALEYFAQKTTAFALGWAYETIENDEGGFYKLVRSNKWVTENELGFFTDSINRYDIDGHGRHVENPKDDYLRPKMSLPEAQTFLAEKLLKPWLINKRELFKLAEGEAIAKYLFHKLNIN